ncbi:tetratricopeptide repeat protein [Paenibacillus koleovorans]|uniref:tetratricopeptide repeat protein n=1 Tax=Paenibacillus koleovorans TaxID=121608 RepID=UPI000FD772CB|nr:tetratricopeptide repeat protein [Paenibacillus koleovorans]
MNGEYRIRMAYQAILNHDFEQAIEWFEQAVREEPDNADYHYRLSITYARSNKLSSALKLAKRAAALDPQHEVYGTHSRNLQGRELAQKASKLMEQGTGDWSRAAALLRRAIRLDGLNLEAHMLLGMAYMGLRRYSQAEEALREALKLDPGREEAQTMLKQLNDRAKLSKR